MDKGFAPAKVNLALHVTGLGVEGFHRLDSLVVFAGVGDQLAARPAVRDLSLAVSGPFAEGVPTDGTNLVLRAAEALRRARGVNKGAALRLTKALPHAAGLGGGSSDAAATLRLLAAFWGVEPLAPDAPEVLALGSDVPVCLQAPNPMRMRGRGEALQVLSGLPSAGLVLVNPGVRLPTRDVFAALAVKENPPMPDGPGPLRRAEDLADWIGSLRNDLQAPAESLCPEVTEALGLLRRAPGVFAAVMSGSGPTCVGITRDAGTARAAARTLQIARPRWWVAPAPMLLPELSAATLSRV